MAIAEAAEDEMLLAQARGTATTLSSRQKLAVRMKMRRELGYFACFVVLFIYVLYARRVVRNGFFMQQSVAGKPDLRKREGGRDTAGAPPPQLSPSRRLKSADRWSLQLTLHPPRAPSHPQTNGSGAHHGALRSVRREDVHGHRDGRGGL